MPRRPGELVSRPRPDLSPQFRLEQSAPHRIPVPFAGGDDGVEPFRDIRVQHGQERIVHLHFGADVSLSLPTHRHGQILRHVEQLRYVVLDQPGIALHRLGAP